MKNILFILLIFILLTPAMAQETKTHSVYFATASFQPDAAALKTLDAVVAYCKEHKASIESISGYCDSTGTRERNQILSGKRADAVKSVFMQKGIDVKNTQVAGKNETLEYDGPDFYRNRRVDIVTSTPVPTENAQGLQQQIAQAEEGDKIRLQNILFYNNSNVPLPEALPVMEELYQVMVNNPTLEIAIEGHICCQSIDTEDISGKRAKAVYDFLIGKGIADTRMTWKGFGHSQPLTLERTEYEEQLNKRVEIRIVKK